MPHALPVGTPRTESPGEPAIAVRGPERAREGRGVFATGAVTEKPPAPDALPTAGRSGLSVYPATRERRCRRRRGILEF